MIDADGLNALAGGSSRSPARQAPTVLTPHAGELGRLLEVDSGEIGAHRLARATRGRRAARAIVVLKGDDTIVAAPGRGRRSSTGSRSPALATAGTGDVLSGMIAALLARGLEPSKRPPRPPSTRTPAPGVPRRSASARRVGDRERRDRGDPGRPATRTDAREGARRVIDTGAVERNCAPARLRARGGRRALRGRQGRRLRPRRGPLRRAALAGGAELARRGGRRPRRPSCARSSPRARRSWCSAR